VGAGPAPRLTLKVPDGEAGSRGSAFSAFVERAKRREEIESMRLLTLRRLRFKTAGALGRGERSREPAYVVGSICKRSESRRHREWLIRPAEEVKCGYGDLAGDRLNDPANPLKTRSGRTGRESAPPEAEVFPLLEHWAPARKRLHRSVYAASKLSTLSAQYYFDRLLHRRARGVAIWNDAEPPSRLRILRDASSAVIHRFCEKFQEAMIFTNA